VKYLVAVGIALLLVGALRLQPTAEPVQESQVVASGPWIKDRCYRVFPSDPDTFHLFKVLQYPAGEWVRVQSYPPSFPAAPGVKEAAPFFLNTRSPFAVQEWPCQ
jgi:hypothetical protein